MKVFVSLAAALAVASPALAAPQVCASCVKSNMEVLAGDALRGRACGTQDENAAAQFLAERLKAYGVQGAAESGGHLQEVVFRRLTYAEKPSLEVGGRRLVSGGEVLVAAPPPEAAGELIALAPGADPAPARGKFVLMEHPADGRTTSALFAAGALAIVLPAPDGALKAWGEIADRPPGVEIVGIEARPRPPRTTIFAKPEALAALKAAVGQTVRLSAPRGEPILQKTYNVLGVIPGRGPDAGGEAILLSAHYDHVGVRDGVIYRGANDDASGTAAVLELARVMAEGEAPRRTVHFALFGCEEQGGHGARYFLAHPPTPLSSIVANLEFEMIGLPDPARPKTLMLTGWERTNLGPTLKAQGADIGPDLYPQENFFQRSDNYQLALKGVVAQTVSAWPTPPTYHQPTDDLAHIDLPFMTQVIQSLVEPIQWLANDRFRPEWLPGMKP